MVRVAFRAFPGDESAKKGPSRQDPDGDRDILCGVTARLRVTTPETFEIGVTGNFLVQSTLLASQLPRQGR